MAKYVSGEDDVVRRLGGRRLRMVKRTVEAVEMTCVDVSNHAKAGHVGNMAHANNRYRNRTSNLTNGIFPTDAEVSPERVHGMVHSSMDYSLFVELGTSINWRTGRPNRPYPFMQPALIANHEVFTGRLKAIAK